MKKIKSDQMSRNSKSVSFEEYRQKSWHDVCTLLEENSGGSGDYFNRGRRNPSLLSASSPLPIPTTTAEPFHFKNYDDDDVVAYQDLPPPIHSSEEDNRGCGFPQENSTTTAEDLLKIQNLWSSRAKNLEDFSCCSNTLSTPPTRLSRQFDRSSHQAEKANELCNNYIMPSSLFKSNHHHQQQQHQYSSSYNCLIPPPTPYKDDSHHPPHPQTKDFNESTYDLIEIKSPRSNLMQSKESDFGLADHHHHQEHPPPSEIGKASSFPVVNQQQQNQLQASTCLSSSYPPPLNNNTFHHGYHQRSRLLRNELFNLPEVYSPPPLQPPLLLEPQPSVMKMKTASSPSSPAPPQAFVQLGRVMPSFMHNPVYLQQQQRRWHYPQQPQTSNSPSHSPRLAYSEPIMKSKEVETNPNSPFQSPSLDSVKARYPIIITPKLFEVEVGGATKNISSSADEPLLKSNLKGKPFHPFTGDGVNRRPLVYEHQADPHLIGNSRNDVVSIPGSMGDGDNPTNNNVSDPIYPHHSKHNCLSPRARIHPNPFIQPSVITASMSENILLECLTNLKSPHWEDNFDAFSQVYNLTEIHPSKVRNMLSKIIWFGLPHLSSPRSKLVRMGCICFKQLFQTQKRYMEVDGEKVFYRLLDLCGGLANNFIQQESRDALVAAVENMDPLKSILFIELHGAKHKNPHVREFSAYLLTAIMDELPQSRLMNKDFSPRIIPMIVGFLREGLLQTRLHGKLALDKVFDHPTFDCKLRRYVSPENVRHIAETLREFKERRSGHI